MSTITKRQIFWRDHVLAAAAFDGTIVEYATLHNLKTKDIYQWKTALTKRGFLPMTEQRDEPDFVTVNPVEQADVNATSTSHPVQCRLTLHCGSVLEYLGLPDIEHVCDDRTRESLRGFYEGLSEQQRKAINTVSMDMWPAFINTTLECIPGAERKIAFDRFHVGQHLGKAVDKVRRDEARKLKAEGNSILVGTKYDWLHAEQNVSPKRKSAFRQLCDSELKTARAWMWKEAARYLWHYRHRTWARKAWERWYSGAIRSRLEPIKKAAWMIKRHLWGIINAVVTGTTNGGAESLNSRIKMVKVRSRGFRNKERFKTAIYFHLGGLQLYPETATR